MFKIAKPLFSIFMLIMISLPRSAASEEQLKPGTGISVTPVFSSLPEEHFRGEIAIAGLRELGYEVLPAKQTGYATMLLALAYGDADFSIHMWDILHDEFYQKAGGAKAILKTGNIIPGLKQGYLIDKKTAEKHGITSLNDLTDPDVAALFDTDKDGKADLTGCNPDWGCKDTIDGHLVMYGLNNTVSHNRGNYFALMEAAIKRYKSGKPILYYTWQPQWISSVLKPGKDVIWLTVEQPETLEGVVHTASISAEDFSATSQAQTAADLGFAEDRIRAAMNLAFAKENPAARTFLSLIQIPATDESAQNLKIMRGEKSPEDITRHAAGWIKKNRQTFDSWLNQARESVPLPPAAPDNVTPVNTDADTKEDVEADAKNDSHTDAEAESHVITEAAVETEKVMAKKAVAERSVKTEKAATQADTTQTASAAVASQ